MSLYGPALGRTEWLGQMGAAMHMFSEITQHYYPTSTCEGVKPAAAAPAATTELLLPAVRQQEDETVRALVQAGSVAARPTRIGETNAAACATSPSSGPVFESALWALDWALRAASGGVSGINFHGGFGICGLHSLSPICAPGDEPAAAYEGDVTAQPEYYGLLAASQLEGGRFVPTQRDRPRPVAELTTWATVVPNGTVKIAIDNFTTEDLAQPISIRTPGYVATVDTLIGPSTGARSGISFGGAAVTGARRWYPKPKPLGAHRSIRVVVLPASAVIVTLDPTR